MNPFPSKPSLQTHMKEPPVFTQFALIEHITVDGSEHSSISVNLLFIYLYLLLIIQTTQIS